MISIAFLVNPAHDAKTDREAQTMSAGTNRKSAVKR